MEHSGIFKEIREKRNCGGVHLHIIENPNGLSLEELLIERKNEIPFFTFHNVFFYRDKSRKELDISPDEIAAELNCVDKDMANIILTELIQADMAHDSEFMSREESASLALGFLSLFDEACIYLTNSDWIPDESGRRNYRISGWNSFTEATFDAGIIVLDKEKCGIAWFEDED